MIDVQVKRLHCIVWAFLYVREGTSSLTVDIPFKIHIGVWARRIIS